MIKKIYSCILVLCTLVSVFALPVLAADSAETTIDRSADIARGEELGFSDFIDVEAYANNAGNPGYDSLTVLRIDIPEVVETINEDGDYFYQWRIPVYFYNPQQLNFFVSDLNLNHIISDSSVAIQDADDSSLSTYFLHFDYLDSEREAHAGYEYMANFMFFKATVKGHYESSSLLESDEGTYYFDSIVLNAGKDLGSFNRFNIPIDKTIKLEGIDYKIDLTKPDYDLSAFFGTDVKDVAAQYPANDDGNITMAYLYEREYGTKDYGLYLYLYNPAGLELVSLGYSKQGKPVYASAKMSFGSTLQVNDFALISASKTLLKLKCVSDLNVGYDLAIRDYYISDINIRVREDNEKTDYVVDCEAHYEYSESPLTDVEKRQFEYVYRISDVIIGDLFDESDYEFCIFADTDNDYSLYVSEGGKLVPAPGLVWQDELSRYFASPSIEGSSISELIDTGHLKTIFLKHNSDFPGISASALSGTIFKRSDAIRDGVLDKLEITFDFVGFSSIGRLEAEASPVLLSNSAETSSSIHMRSDVKGEISIKCDSTFYRINSSASGTAYQQTLSTVGFALDSSYFNVDDLDVTNDFYLDFVHFTYRGGYLKPAFVTTDCNFLAENGFLPGSSRVQLYNGYYIYSGVDTVTGNGFTTFYPDIWFGPVPEPGLAYGYSPDKQYNYIPFIFMVQHEGDFEDFEYVLTQDEIETVLEKFSEGQIFDGEVTPVDKTITFKDKTELLSYRDATFNEVSSSLGFFSALLHKLCGMDDTVMESIGSINCIEMIVPDDYSSILLMSDEEFSSTYLVALNEAGDIKSKVLDALLNNQVYTFLRFDAYDYYAADATVAGLEHNGDAFIFQEKYYKDFDIIELGISNEQETVVYTVKMDPIDFLAGGTSPDVTTKDDVTTPGEYIKNELGPSWEEFLKNLEKFGKIAAIVAGAVAVIALVIGGVRLVIYVRNARTLNKMRKQINSADKHRKRKRKSKDK